MKKYKTKQKAFEHRSSIRELHNKRLDEIIENDEKMLNEKQKRLDKLEIKYAKKLKKNGPKNELFSMERQIKELKSQLEKIKNKEAMTEYLLDVQAVLHKKSLDSNVNTINNITNDNSIKQEKINYSNKNGVDNFLISKTTNSKQKILDEYLTITGGCPSNVYTQHYDLKDFKCNECESNTMLVDSVKSLIICKECGLSQDWQDPNLPQWSDTVGFTKQYRYKRPKYFEDHLNRFQAKENVTIPPELLQQILKELNKRRIRDISKINYKLIKSILQHLDKSSYYDNINTIICKLSGQKPPKLTKELELRLKHMFDQTLEPFSKWKHLIKSRSNYLSYPYTIRKFLEIINYERGGDKNIEKMIPYFKKLKSLEKNRDQEKVFEKICIELNWPFIKSSF